MKKGEPAGLNGLRKELQRQKMGPWSLGKGYTWGKKRKMGMSSKRERELVLGKEEGGERQGLAQERARAHLLFLF